MTQTTTNSNIRPDFDQILTTVADYVVDKKITGELAYKTARWCLLDTLGCGILALNTPQCTKLLGPIVPGAELAQGARVPGTAYQLDPVQAAFNIGTTQRWLDFNDTWLAAEWGHPSDNLAGILAISDYGCRQGNPLTLRDVLTALIKAYEIQGVLALENAFNRVGLDHVVLVKVATTAVVAQLLGADKQTICNALSLAWIDGQSLRTYRHAPNTGSRKSWAAGDAAARGVWLALLAMRGEMGYPSALSAKQWGFQDALFNGEQLLMNRPLASYVIENILFKVAFPTEFHGQTAVEAALQLHPQVMDRLEHIQQIKIRTQQSAMRIIDKQGPLHNPADRDHCLQYMVAVSLIFGELTAKHYENEVARDPRIDALRNKMVLAEDKQFSKDYLDADKRSIANAVQIFFNDGSKTEEVVIEYPLGHQRRRQEAEPLLVEKFTANFSTKFSPAHTEKMLALLQDEQRLDAMRVDEFMDKLMLSE